MEPKPIGLEPEPLRVLVYGDPGVGKTTLALTFPRPVVIDTDGGLISVVLQRPGENLGLAARPEGVLDVESLVRWLLAKQGTYDTIVIDSIDALVELLIHELVEEHAKTTSRGPRPLLTRAIPEQVEYLAARNEVRALLAALRALNVHVVLTAGMRVSEQNFIQQRGPDVPPAVGRMLMKWSSLVGELIAGVKDDTFGDKEAHRLLVIAPTQDRQAKSRYADLGDYVLDPTFGKLWDPVLARFASGDNNTERR